LPYKSVHNWIGTVASGERVLERNGIPEHPVGLFPLHADSQNDECACGRPTAIKEQKNNDGSYPTYKVPLFPGEVSANESSVRWLYLPEEFGIAINGVELDPTADEWLNNDRTTGWEKNALQHPDMMGELDCNMAHVQNEGVYHYHGLPIGLYEGEGGTYPWNTGSGILPILAKTVLLGYGSDGFPAYGPTCYKAPASSAGKYLVGRNWWKPKPSWVLRSGDRGPNSPGGPYNGDYDQDYEYIAGKGDLDLCNGHFAPTPENPNGIYHYHITVEFPYIPRCLRLKKISLITSTPLLPGKGDKPLIRHTKPPIRKKMQGPGQGNQ
jgi:hypothetical protein